MKAAVVTRYGPPEVVRVAEVPTPSSDKDSLVRIRVHATTVNRTDCGIRAARPFFIRLRLGLSRPRVPVLGSEFAGVVVEAAGAGVTPSGRATGFSASPMDRTAAPTPSTW